MDIVALYGASFDVILKIRKEDENGVLSAFPVADYTFTAVQMPTIGNQIPIENAVVTPLPDTAYPGFGAIDVFLPGAGSFAMSTTAADVRIEAKLKANPNVVVMIYLAAETDANGVVTVGKVSRV